MTKVIVRKFQEGDVSEVIGIFEAYGLIRDDEGRRKSSYHLEKAAKEPAWYAHHLVAELDRKVVGRVILEAPYPPYSELVNLYVHPDYLGRGVGSSLVQKCIDMASTQEGSLMSVMTDPVGNLPAHRLYSKFGFKPGILGNPSAARGHMWLFRFAEQSFLSEFLKDHPFAEPSVSPSKVRFHGRMLYSMAWRDPQTGEKMALYLEGQPSQTLEGTMPRIAGFSYDESDTKLDVIVKEKSRLIKRGETIEFTFSIWNFGSRTQQIISSSSIPDGTELTPLPQHLSPIEIDQERKRTIRFKFRWPSNCELPDFTSFSTVPSTCFIKVRGLDKPLFASAGFDRQQPL